MAPTRTKPDTTPGATKNAPQRARTIAAPQQIVAAQAIAGAIVVLVWGLVNPAEMSSALLGVLVVLLPNCWLALQFRTTQPAGREVGQALAKFGLTVLLIFAVFVVSAPSAPGFFSTLVVCSLTPLLAPLFLLPARLAVVPRLPTQNAPRPQRHQEQVSS